MSRTTGLTRQAVRQTVNSLARDGLVAFRDNPLDRRAHLVALTPRGRVALRDLGDLLADR
ncbi:MarR family transcriptional regulator [Actinosynnema sp. NPDC023587]|uniref:MarR family transcriptional regulator n=1 Tax=Actinosynnema sp. NPDC023587 TaxID=3154695 RepID=UPI0033C4F0D4